MVRWIKKADGTYDYDFSIMDKYLDLSLKSMTKPTFVVFTAWEIYLDTPKQEVKVDEKDSELRPHGKVVAGGPVEPARQGTGGDGPGSVDRPDCDGKPAAV